jgi:hypothetical protein
MSSDCKRAESTASAFCEETDADDGLSGSMAGTDMIARGQRCLAVQRAASRVCEQQAARTQRREQLMQQLLHRHNERLVALQSATSKPKASPQQPPADRRQMLLQKLHDLRARRLAGSAEVVPERSTASDSRATPTEHSLERLAGRMMDPVVRMTGIMMQTQTMATGSWPATLGNSYIDPNGTPRFIAPDGDHIPVSGAVPAHVANMRDMRQTPPPPGFSWHRLPNGQFVGLNL